MGHLTLTRFFALHAGLFSAIFGVLVCCLYRVIRRADDAPGTTKKCAGVYWPEQTERSALACLAVLAVIVLMTFGGGLISGRDPWPGWNCGGSV